MAARSSYQLEAHTSLFTIHPITGLNSGRNRVKIAQKQPASSLKNGRYLHFRRHPDYAHHPAKLDSSNPNSGADDANQFGGPPPLPPPHHEEAFAHMGHSNLDSIRTNRKITRQNMGQQQ
ncbi:Hypothetical predicted protein [Olea europaea subsp. europaea]|uniref:Uncharacterized protein n=1 Tax=Olea europaea subsp. europaea TaxID=158383 RepID=A0A8S0SLY3_OLEEU|nr:Hypothetical predicted protein [Olea europaea subsp. europaea]CAA3012338.1 Hypothetical predicted protein [Olea europaea subsp. europaea]